MSTRDHASEKIYTCEVKRMFVRDGQKLWDWKEVSVADAIRDEDEKVRCKDCWGAVRLHGRHVQHGPAPHAEHRSKQDSEYCPAGMYFRQNRGRVPRKSAKPVE